MFLGLYEFLLVEAETRQAKRCGKLAFIYYLLIYFISLMNNNEKCKMKVSLTQFSGPKNAQNKQDQLLKSTKSKIDENR